MKSLFLNLCRAAITPRPYMHVMEINNIPRQEVIIVNGVALVIFQRYRIRPGRSRGYGLRYSYFRCYCFNARVKAGAVGIKPVGGGEFGVSSAKIVTAIIISPSTGCR